MPVVIVVVAGLLRAFDYFAALHRRLAYRVIAFYPSVHSSIDPSIHPLKDTNGPATEYAFDVNASESQKGRGFLDSCCH